MKIYKRGVVLLIFAITLIIVSCKTNIPTISLTLEQESVKIVAGNQTSTLELTKTHSPIATEKVQSEYQARARAVLLGADTAQLIFNDNYSTFTYRFWKLKN